MSEIILGIAERSALANGHTRPFCLMNGEIMGGNNGFYVCSVYSNNKSNIRTKIQLQIIFRNCALLCIKMFLVEPNVDHLALLNSTSSAQVHIKTSGSDTRLSPYACSSKHCSVFYKSIWIEIGL